jgi:hypothetical protein
MSSAVVALMSLMQCPDEHTGQQHVVKAIVQQGESYTTMAASQPA